MAAALFAAVRAGCDLGRLLALPGADIAQSDGGESLLCCAVRFENAAAAAAIAALPEFDAAQQRADEALALAIQADFAAGVRLLAPLVDINGKLPRMPPITVDGEPAEETALAKRMHPLAAAALLGARAALAELLAVDGVDVNARTPDGAPVLFAVLGDRELLGAVCRMPGLDVNARDARGNTVLHRIVGGALMSGQGEALRIVCAQGADRKARNGAGRSPWEIAKAGRAGAAEPEETDAWIGLAVGAVSTSRDEWDSVATPARRGTAPAFWDA